MGSNPIYQHWRDTIFNTNILDICSVITLLKFWVIVQWQGISVYTSNRKLRRRFDSVLPTYLSEPLLRINSLNGAERKSSRVVKLVSRSQHDGRMPSIVGM